jgi:hypothetical protein
MNMTLAHPLKTVGRVVLGPRRVRNGYARIVAKANGSGRIELFDMKAGSWREAFEECSFDDVWSGSPVFDSQYLRVLACTTDC